jgi:hypothetical protein
MKWFNAARKGDLGELRRQLQAGQDVDATGSKGRTALLVAAEAGQAEAVKLLLEAGADPNVHVERIGRPLTVAVNSSHYDVAVALIDAGADPNHGGVARYLISTQRVDLLQEMLRRGLDPNGRHPLFGSYLKEAIDSAYYEKVTGPHGTGLQLASKNVKPNTRCLDALLAAGGDIARAEAADGEWFLRTPTLAGDDKMIRRLIALGAKPEQDKPRSRPPDPLLAQAAGSRRGTLRAWDYDAWQTIGIDVGDNAGNTDLICNTLAHDKAFSQIQRDVTETALAGTLDQPTAPHLLILKLKRHRWALVHASAGGSGSPVAQQIARQAKRPTICCGYQDTAGATAFHLYDETGKPRIEFVSTGEDYRARSKDDLDRVEYRTSFKSDSHDENFWKQHADENETLQALVRQQQAYLPAFSFSSASGKLKLHAFPDDALEPANLERIVLAVYGQPSAGGSKRR